MKKLFSILITMHAFVILLLFTSCQTKTEHITQLSPQQWNLLLTPRAANTVVFDENGNRTTTIVNSVLAYRKLTRENKGGMYTGGGDLFYNELGRTSYNESPNSNYKIYINVASEDPYNPNLYPAIQQVYVNNTSSISYYAIDFNNKLSSKTINGVTYTDVVLGIDPHRNDTLFWKKDIGILGWKRADVNWTAYRVF